MVANEVKKRKFANPEHIIKEITSKDDNTSI
jgi:hypothetical protein